MDIKRSILIVALAIVSYALVLQWNKDYGQPELPAQTASFNQQPQGLPETSVPAGGTASADVPTAQSGETGLPSAQQPAAANGQLIQVKTDVLDLAIDPRGGDVVQLGNHSGLVEGVTLRFVQLRDYDGNVHYVPNGHITTVINMSRGFSQAVMDIRVAFREDVDAVVAVMRRVGEDMRSDEAFAPRILDALEIAGVDRWAESGLVIRCRFRTQPLEQWGVRREYLRRLKAAFDAEGIEIPYPHLTVYAGADRAGKAPAFPMQQVTQH